MKVFAHYMGNEKDWNLSEDGLHEEGFRTRTVWYENIRYRFYPGLQVTFDKKTVQAYCKQLHLSVYFTLLFNLLDKYQIKVH